LNPYNYLSASVVSVPLETGIQYTVAEEAHKQISPSSTSLILRPMQLLELIALQNHGGKCIKV
jgi:hypothetical protein